MSSENQGGTLVVVGSVEFDHLDTASGYLTQTWALTRNFARTLFNIRGSERFADAARIRPDVAAEIPTVGNGQISDDGLVYRVRLRDGVRWDTQPPREVVAADFVRALKRLCNPAQPSGALPYYLTTIAGLAEFEEGFRKVDATDPAKLAVYQNDHDISGVRAVDPRTLEFRLIRPASDFLRLLSLQFTAAAPVEYDRSIPDSPEFRCNVVSNGPYRIARYQERVELLLERNPVWRADRDEIRGQYVDRISVRFGEHSPAVVQEMIERGAADISWDQRVPTARIATLLQEGDPNLLIAPEAMSSPYLAFNVSSPNNGGALRSPEVRRAISWAIDKAAIAEVYGGSVVCTPLHQVIPPGAFGHRRYEPYRTEGDHGDPATSRRLLDAAGFPEGSVTLRFPYRTSSSYPEVARIVATDLERCGIAVELIPDPEYRYYGEIMHTPSEALAGTWDIALPAWVPDWYGNNGRSSIVPLFDGRVRGVNSPNYGGYSNATVNAAIDRALEAPTEEAAAEHWHEADRLIVDDAAFVPLLNQRYPIYHSARAQNARYLPVVQVFEYNQIWLRDA